jgi:RNA polymerase sigma-70 factor, ECF subfamily
MIRAKRFERGKEAESTDDGLLRQMLAGDEDAFTLLYRRRHPGIYRFALHMTGNAAVAEDVTQEVFMTLIRNTERFDPARGTVGGFLFGIARNHLRKRWEQDRRMVALREGVEDDGHFESPFAQAGSVRDEFGRANGNGNGAMSRPADQFVVSETASRVRQAVATLPENYREVVVLCELEEMSYEEAAAALSCPVGTIRSRLHRARTLLIEKLRDYQPVGRVAEVGE